MTLRTRVAKIEYLANYGHGNTTDRELEEAERLLDRAADVHVHELIWGEPHPDAVLILAAEASGEVEAAREVRRRYWKARGVDYDACEREDRERVIEPYLQHLRDVSDAIERGEDTREMMGPSFQASWDSHFRRRRADRTKAGAS
jgi:hypothetical protein